MNGGDRIRWLLNSGASEIPVSIYWDIGVEKASTGLILRRVQTDDVIRVKNCFDPDLIIAGKLVRRASIHDGVFDRILCHCTLDYF